MSSIDGGLMGCARVSLLAAAAVMGGCEAPNRGEPGTPATEEPTYVAPGEPVETEDRMYALTFTPFGSANFPWPEYPGLTRMNVHVATGPGFVIGEDDVDDATPEPTMVVMPAYPLMLTFDAVVPPASAIGDASFPQAWSTRSDGTEWAVAVDFAAPGDWVVPVKVADNDGHIDYARLTFRISAPRREGRSTP